MLTALSWNLFGPWLGIMSGSLSEPSAYSQLADLFKSVCINLSLHDLLLLQVNIISIFYSTSTSFTIRVQGKNNKRIIITLKINGNFNMLSSFVLYNQLLVLNLFIPPQW